MVDPDTNPMAQAAVGRVYDPAPRVRPRHAEGSVTRLVEQQTAKLPSSLFLTLAIGAMTASAVMELTGRVRLSRFFGLWAPTLLIAGVYNKMVKTFGTR